MAIEEIMKYVVAAIGIANICLLLGLLYIYIGNLRQAKSEFTLGLVVFAFFLLLQNIAFTILLFAHEEFARPGLRGPLLIIKMIELIAYAVLFKITWK
jgi:hypothetical protein